METNTRKLNECGGWYMPAFFDMFVNTDKPITSLNLFSLDDNERSIFFHEYIHFMQDFMTTCGLNNIYCINEKFRLIANDYASQNPFLVPVILKDNKCNVRLNGTLNGLAWGGQNDFTILNILSIRTIPYTDEDMQTANLTPFRIVILNTNNGELGFGKREIMESMAYILQRLCTRISYFSPEYPYCSAEKVSQHLCHTGFENNLLNLVALCDVSLMSSNPGYTFIEYLNRIESGELTISVAEDVYTDFYSRNGVSNGVVMNPLDHFVSLSAYAKSALKSYIDIETINKTLYAWIDMVFDTGLNIRRNDKCFFLTLARAGYIMQNPYFLNLLATVGTPLMRNNKGAYGRCPSNPDYGDIFQYLMAVRPVYNIFYGNFKCALSDFCLQSAGHSKIKTNQYCAIAPWERRNDTDLCPVAMIIKHRKLAINEPTLRGKVVNK